MLNENILDLLDTAGRRLGETRNRRDGSVNLVKIRDVDQFTPGWTNIEAYRQFIAQKPKVLSFINHVRRQFYPDVGMMSLDQARVLSCGITSTPEYLLSKERIRHEDPLPEYLAAAIKSFMGMSKLLFWCTAQNSFAHNNSLSADPNLLYDVGQKNGLFWDGKERCPVNQANFLNVATVFTCAETNLGSGTYDADFELSGLFEYATVSDRFLKCAMGFIYLTMALEENCQDSPEQLNSVRSKVKILGYLATFADEAEIRFLNSNDALGKDFPCLWKQVRATCVHEATVASKRMELLFQDTAPPVSRDDLLKLIPESPYDRLIGFAKESFSFPNTEQ